MFVAALKRFGASSQLSRIKRTHLDCGIVCCSTMQVEARPTLLRYFCIPLDVGGGWQHCVTSCGTGSNVATDVECRCAARYS